MSIVPNTDGEYLHGPPNDRRDWEMDSHITFEENSYWDMEETLAEADEEFKRLDKIFKDCELPEKDQD